MSKTIMTVSVLLTVILFFSGCMKEAETGPDAVLSFIAGEVKVNGETVTATGKPIHYNDVIETGDNGTCRIQIGEKTVLQLKSGSRLEYKVSAKDNTLKLDRGWLAGITRKIFTSQGKYTVQTPTMVASVRARPTA